MDGRLIPEGAYPSVLAPFEDVTTVQFNHRMTAYVVTAAVVALWFAGRRRRVAAVSGNVLLAALALQMLLGIWTLLAVVPIWLGALHQAGAVALLTASIIHADTLHRT
jgi:cytochrome c oxidase assembly protein subunit 15